MIDLSFAVTGAHAALHAATPTLNFRLQIQEAAGSAIHGVLLPGRAANERLARLLAILFGVPFRAVRFAHLRHHRYNRTPWGREEIYDPAERPRSCPRLETG